MKFVTLGKTHLPAFNSTIRGLLVAGIQRGWKGQQNAIARVQEIRPDLSFDVIDSCMQALAADGLPSWLKPGFWTTEMDCVLLAGIRGGSTTERLAVDNILRLRPELRPEVIWSRINHLRRRKLASGTVSFTCTLGSDTALCEQSRSGRATAPEKPLQHLHNRLSNIIARDGRKSPRAMQQVTISRPWTIAELRFLVESVQHFRVKTIANKLNRTEKAVWRKMAEVGLSGKCVEGYTVSEILKKMHVSHHRLRKWIEAGYLRIGRNNRVTERSMRLFLRGHFDELNLTLLDSETAQWLFEMGVEVLMSKEVRARRLD